MFCEHVVNMCWIVFELLTKALGTQPKSQSFIFTFHPDVISVVCCVAWCSSCVLEPHTVFVNATWSMCNGSTPERHGLNSPCVWNQSDNNLMHGTISIQHWTFVDHQIMDSGVVGLSDTSALDIWISVSLSLPVGSCLQLYVSLSWAVLNLSLAVLSCR